MPSGAMAGLPREPSLAVTVLYFQLAFGRNVLAESCRYEWFSWAVNSAETWPAYRPVFN